MVFFTLVTFGFFLLENLVEKFMNCNSQFKENVVLFLNGNHCFVHKTNITVIALFDLELVHQLEVILQNFYAFFCSQTKEVP